MQRPGELTASRRRSRIRFVLFSVVFCFSIVTLSLFRIQVSSHEYYLSVADAQHTHTVQLEPRRGRIYDRSGYLLAGNTSVVTFEVYWPSVIQEQLPRIDSLVARLGDHALVGVPVERWSSNQTIARSVPLETASPILAGGVPAGVNWRIGSVRSYPMGEMCAAVLGRWSPDLCEGLEMSMDHLLRGEAGFTVVERSAFPGLHMPSLDAERRPSRDGVDLRLTIDSRFQTIVQEELQRGVDESGAAWGAAVVMDPWSGEILALGSYPVRSGSGCLAVNHCISGYHEPGSTFKVVTLAACLEEGVLVPSDTFDCSRGQIPVADRIISDCHRYGTLTIEEIAAHSSNVGIVKMVSLLPDSVIFSYCRRMGFGSRTGIELPGESEGILRPPDQWSGLSRASLAIGQEVAVTPLQLACAFCAIANGGRLVRPRLILASCDGERWRDWADLPASRALEAGTSSMVLRMLETAVEEGTGTTAAVPGIRVAGKTGTAERLSQGEDEYLSAFVGLLPAESPDLVIAVVFDGPDYEYRFGSALAAPAFATMAREILAVEPELAMGHGSSPDSELLAGRWGTE
ncbi:penicillin-binding protein 2 [Candidatus Fermentibacterales bacterium]|nr:penicillin-binding protein 2 [Candidatus Fermentibacterales bacterium]